MTKGIGLVTVTSREDIQTLIVSIGCKVKTKRAKTWPLENQDAADDQATRVQFGQGSSDHPTNGELLEWAATQRKLYKEGKLPDAFVKALEAVPGWTWEQNSK
jgi:hypothetical protein